MLRLDLCWVHVQAGFVLGSGSGWVQAGSMLRLGLSLVLAGFRLRLGSGVEGQRSEPRVTQLSPRISGGSST